MLFCLVSGPGSCYNDKSNASGCCYYCRVGRVGKKVNTSEGCCWEDNGCFK